MNPELKPLADLIESLIESLGREMHEGFARLEARLDGMNNRLDLQGGKLRAGSVWSTRVDAWSDGVDRLLAERDKQINDLQQRVSRLERGQA